MKANESDNTHPVKNGATQDAFQVEPVASESLNGDSDGPPSVPSNLEIASISERSLRGMQQISDRSVSLTRILGGIGWAIFTLIAFVSIGSVMFFGGLYNLTTFSICGGLLFLSGLIGWSALIYPMWKYETTGWRLDDSGFKIRSGIFWREIISVPRSRIQHADVHQGPLMRIYGLANLIVHTAGTENASVMIDGLQHDVAERIRDELIQTDERPVSDDLLAMAPNGSPSGSEPITADVIAMEVVTPKAAHSDIESSDPNPSDSAAVKTATPTEEPSENG